MRGTGCSGGAFDYFEQLQSTDGYDAIETIAAQPWVAHHKVGMVGLSYPGISQLFVAQLRPPHLAAIAPLSVIDDTIKGTLSPGGVLNTGFAVVVGEGPSSTMPSPRPAADSRGRPIASTPATRRASRTRRCTARRSTRDRDREGEVLDGRHRCCRCRPSTSCRRSTCPCTSRPTGRTSRPAGTSRTSSTSSPERRTRGSPRRTAVTPTRSIPQCSRVGCSSCRSSSRRRCRIRPHLPASSRRRSATRRSERRAAAAGSVRERQEVRAGEADVRGASRASASSSRTAVAPTPGAPARALRGRLPVVARPGPTATPWYFGADGTLVGARRRRGAPTRTCTTRRTSTTRRSRTESSATVGQAARLQWNPPKAGTALAYETPPLVEQRDGRRELERRSLVEVDCDRHRHPGDDHRGAPRRQRVVRAKRLAACERSALLPDATALRPTHPFTKSRATAAGGEVLAKPASRCCRSRTCSAPVRASA